MTHEDRGHYANKHPLDRKINQEITEEVKRRVSDGEIPCAVAFSIASDLNVPPAEVGFTIDSLEIPIVKCQLGLHGYRPRKKIVGSADKVSPALEEAIQEKLVNDRLTCTAAWEIAERFGLSRMEICSACEGLKIKISSCQLGAF